MKIRVYQINSDKDENRMMFMAYDRLELFQGSSEIDCKIYDKVYDKEVACSNLEEVYMLLNIHRPADYEGRSLSVSDVVEVYESDTISPGFYFCDSCGFEEVTFHPEECSLGKRINEEPKKVTFDWELGHEIVYPNIYEDAFSMYVVDESCLFRYAARRAVDKKIKKLIREKTNITLRTKR